MKGHYPMQIQSTPNYNAKSPNFKAVSIVQIPRKAFKNPENYKECRKIFANKLDKLVGDRLTGRLGAILALFTTKPHKTANLLENYALLNARVAMDINNMKYSINWLEQNTGLAIPKALDENFHSFYVYTKDDIGKVMSTVKQATKNLWSNTKEAITKYPKDKRMTNIYAATKIGVQAEALRQEIFKDTPVQKFKIENLDELKNIVKDLDV